MSLVHVHAGRRVMPMTRARSAFKSIEFFPLIVIHVARNSVQHDNRMSFFFAIRDRYEMLQTRLNSWSIQGSLRVYNPVTEQEQTSIPSICELIKHLHDGQPRGYRQNRADKDTSTGRTIKAPQPSTEHKNPADQGNLLYKRNLEKDIRFLSFPLLFAAPLELGVGRGCVETWHV